MSAVALFVRIFFISGILTAIVLVFHPQSLRQVSVAHKEVDSFYSQEEENEVRKFLFARELMMSFANGACREIQSPADSEDERMESAVEEVEVSTIHEVTIPVNGKDTFHVKFDSSLHQPQDVAERFCRERAFDLGFATEEELVANCIPYYTRFIAGDDSSSVRTDTSS